MASWTRLMWDESLTMAKFGSKSCHVEENPLNIFCDSNKIKRGKRSFVDSRERIQALKRKWSFYLRMFDFQPGELQTYITAVPSDNDGLTVQFDMDGLIENVLKKDFVQKIIQGRPPRKILLHKQLFRKPTKQLMASNEFSRFGQDLLVADLNQNGLNDIVIAAPGHQDPGSHSTGCVFVFLDYAVAPTMNSSQRLCSPASDLYGNFGKALAFANRTLFVGSPTVGTQNLTYQGKVYSFKITQRYDGNIDFGQPEDITPFSDDTLTSTFGWSMATSASGDSFIGARHQTHFNGSK